jgi:ABC-type bacteriocin/lantibiotic exporter with double-glycine peptidase domain
MKHLSYLRALFSFAFRNNPLLFVAVVVSVFSVFIEITAMATLMPLASVAAGNPLPGDTFSARLIKSVGAAYDGRSLLLLFLGLFFVRVLTQLVSQTLTIYLGKRILLQLTTRAFSALIRNIPIKELESKSLGHYVSLAGDEAARSSNLIVLVSQLVSTGLLGMLYFLAVWRYSAYVGIGVVIFLAVTFAALFESFRASHRLGIRQIEQSQAATSFFVDAVNGLRSVRSFSAEGYVTESYYRQIFQYMRTLSFIDVISLGGRLAPVLFLLASVAVLALFNATSGLLSLDLPFIVTIVILLMRFFPIAGQALNISLRVVSDARAGRDVTSVIDQYGVSPTGVSSNSALASRVTRVEASDLEFSHVNGKPVLRGFNIILKRGHSYAFIGPSGSGKSTFLDLLLGFYPPDNGRLLLDGLDFKSIAVSELRRRVLLVAQDTAIFNDTVANNLTLGSDFGQHDLDRACRIAGIDDMIAGLEKGYDTLLSYRGSNLSGGQKQRIGIARAVLRQPDVLLLDESTSALDVETRERVVSNLLEEFKDRIILFVTHDAFVASKVDEAFDMSVLNGVNPADSIAS